MDEGRGELSKYISVTGLKLYPVELYVFVGFLPRSLSADESHVDCIFIGFSI